MDSFLKMNKFEIVDMPGMNTLAFLVGKDNYGSLYLEKMKSSDINEGGEIKKAFRVIIEQEDDEDDIVLLTLTDRKAYLSTGILDSEGFRTVATNVPLNYGSIYNAENVEYKEVKYTKDFKRNFSIIDTQTGEEVIPSSFVDQTTGQVKSTCKIMPNRPYIVLEVTEDDNDDDDFDNLNNIF